MSKQHKRKQKIRCKLKGQRSKLHDRNGLRNRITSFGKKLTRRQFDAYCYCRMPLVRFTAEEIEWYSFFDNKLLGVVLRDVTDNDFGFIILGRDSRKLFRCIEVGADFFDSPVKARKALAHNLYDNYRNSVQETYPQDDETDAGFDLFRDLLEENQQHQAYKVLKNEQRYEAARNIISEIVNSFVDNDGHYEREFQSVNFQARLWELYLHVYIHNAGLMIENRHPSPDFEVSYFGEKFFIEAVTVNPSENQDRLDLPPPKTQEEIEHRWNDFMPIKFGSTLYSKLNKKYWEKEHVKGHPLVLAIHDYHNDNSMTWSRTALSEYLYGIRVRVVDGVTNIQKIDKHTWDGKDIVSGFFKQEGAENISAVLFSNQGTIPKFNRMGKIAGLGSADVKMIRTGYRFNPDPEAIYPLFFSENVDDPNYEESWSDGLVMFHNPNAKYPLDHNLLGDISHVFYSEEEGFHGYSQPYDVLGSMTMVVTTKPDEDTD